MKNKEVLATNVPIDALVNIETKCITKVRKYMKMFFFIGSLAAMGLFLNSCMEGYVTTEPTYVEYSRPQRPSELHIWVDGDWVYNRTTHVYVQKNGYWQQPRQNRTYVSGHWQSSPRGHYWVSGHYQNHRRHGKHDSR